MAVGSTPTEGPKSGQRLGGFPGFFCGAKWCARRAWICWEPLGVLVRVAETGSFSAVAREREISQSAVTRQISQLEEHFKVRLFHRTTRRLSLTDDGEVLLGHARTVLDEVETMEVALGRQSSSPTGLVRLGITVVGSRFLTPRLPLLLDAHPGLKVELMVSDKVTDMIEERLDLAVRAGEQTDLSLRARIAGMFGRAVVAAPSYLERHGAPSSPSDLTEHVCLVHDTGPELDVWAFDTPDGVQTVRVSGGFIANDSSAVRLAARAGHGIALLAEIQAFDDLRDGTLVRLLNEYRGSAPTALCGVSVASASGTANALGDGVSAAAVPG